MGNNMMPVGSVNPNFNNFRYNIVSTNSTNPQQRTISPPIEKKIPKGNNKPRLNTYLKVAGGILLTGLAAVGAVKTYKYVKFRTEVKKAFEECWAELEKGKIAQKIGLKKPALKIPFFCKDKSAFAYYTEKTNTVVVNYKQMKNYKYGLISKSKSKVSINPYCDKEYLAELKKSGSITKFNVIDLNEKEQMLLFKSVLSHELRHAFQFQAMISSSQVGKAAYIQKLKAHWTEQMQKAGKNTQNVDKTFDKIIKKNFPFIDKNEFKSVDIPEIFRDGKNSLTPEAIADNFINYKESKGNIEIWANHLIERDAQCYSIKKTFRSKEAPDGVNKDWYKAVRAIEEYRYENIFK